MIKEPLDNKKSDTPQAASITCADSQQLARLCAELRKEHEEHPTVYDSDRRIKELLLTSAETLELLTKMHYVTENEYEAVCEAIVMLQVFDECMRKRSMPAGISPCRKKVGQIINALKYGNTPQSNEAE